MKRKILLFYALFICVLSVCSQVSVEVLIDSTQMVVGEQTGMHVTANIKKGQSVVFRQWKPQEMLAPGVEVLSAPVVDTVDTEDGYLKVTQHLVLLS